MYTLLSTLKPYRVPGGAQTVRETIIHKLKVKAWLKAILNNTDHLKPINCVMFQNKPAKATGSVVLQWELFIIQKFFIN